MVSDPLGYYARLGVAPSASAAEVKAAFRAKARVLHPDVPGSGDGRAFQRLHEAYRVLSDPHRRAAYDRSSYAPLPFDVMAPAPAGWPSPQPARRRPRAAVGGLTTLAVLGVAGGLYLAVQATPSWDADPPAPRAAALADLPVPASDAAKPVGPTAAGHPPLAGEPSHYILPGAGPAPLWAGDPGGNIRRIGELPAFTPVHASALINEGLQGVNMADGSLAYVDASRLMPGDAADAERARCAYLAGRPPANGEVLARGASGDRRLTIANHGAEPAVVSLAAPDGRLAARVFLEPGAETELAGLPEGRLVQSASFGELWSRGCERFVAGPGAAGPPTPVAQDGILVVTPQK